MTAASASLEHPAGFARALRSLLWRARCEHLQAKVEQLLADVKSLQQGGTDAVTAFRDVYVRARHDVIQQLVRDDYNAEQRNGEKTERLLNEFVPESPRLDGPDFQCDAGLGGLARLLRAAGYDAAFWPGIDDDELIQKTLASSAILLTNDRLLMERGVIQRGVVPALLVPITIKKREQFALVLDALELPLRSPRCMSCGGRLVTVEKESVRDRIPPRTYPWRDDYFVCERCDKLFWRGTHWERIRGCLAEVAGGKSAPPAGPVA